MPRPQHNSGFKRPKNTKKTLSRLVPYFMHYKWQLLVVVVCIIAAALASVIGTALLTPLVDDCIVPLIGQNNPNISKMISVLIQMGVVYAIGVVTIYVYNRLMVSISAGILSNVRKDMFKKMVVLPLSYSDSHTHGKIMSLYTNDTDAMREMIGQGVPQLINSAVRIIGVFTMMIVLSPSLTLLAIVMLALMLFAVSTLAKKSGAYFKKRQQSLASVNGYMEEMIEGQKVVKVFCHEDNVEKHFSVLNEELRVNAKSANAWANVLMPIMGNLSYIHFAITALCGAILVTLTNVGQAGAFLAISIGGLTSFLQYTRNFSQPITQVSQQLNSILSALAGAERIFDLIDTDSEDDSGSVTLCYANKDNAGNITESDTRTGIWAWKRALPDGNAEFTELLGDVRLNNVTFSYDGTVNVLNNVSFYAKAGQKIALVGSTGAGKTTITNLINRFYDISEGEITYDGIDIRDIRRSDLRRSLSMVLQDTHLFTGTVMENIRYGRLDATDEEIIAAAKLSNAHFFISHLPDGYNTMLTTDGENLSQGQRQLLNIARVAVSDPPVLILDEATSSIDTRTERLIEKGMDTLMKGRTVFVIAHRLSTVRNSNAIMVLEHGKIVERGSHEELLAQKGRYYSLYTGDFELD